MPDDTIDQRQIVADLKRELAARTAERDEALAREAAVAEVLQVINASPGDLAPVFDAMLEKAMRLCDATGGALRAYDDGIFRAVAMRGVSAEFLEATREVRPDPETGLGRIEHGERVVQIDDIADPDHPRAQTTSRRYMVELGGIRTSLWVALRQEETLLGSFVLYRKEVRPFTDQQIALVESFAAQAVIAMENARLITETREALAQQTATAEVLGVINSSRGDLAPVFDAMLDKALRLCGAAFGAVSTFSDGNVTHRAYRGSQEAINFFLSRPPHRPGPGSAHARLMAGESLVQVTDALAEQSHQHGERVGRATVDLAKARSLIAVPLRKADMLHGAIMLYRQDVRPFSGKEVALLQNFAAQAVIAMENARLLGELRQRTDEIAAWNRELEARVASQLAELERTGKLRRFLAPQLADLIVAQGDESILESHRREIVVVFCDVRGFTPFAERAEPEEVMALLREYHDALGPIVMRYEGTLDHYGGDGVMVFFNDPLPTPEPAKRAIEMAVAMRQAAAQVIELWRRDGHEIGFGVGISQGYATLGQIGFAERMDYTAIGTVTNLAARLCQEAKDGQILVSRRVARAVADMVDLEEIGEVSLKGLSQPVAVFNIA